MHTATADGSYTRWLNPDAELLGDLVANLIDEIRGDYNGITAYYRPPKIGKGALTL